MQFSTLRASIALASLTFAAAPTAASSPVQGFSVTTLVSSDDVLANGAVVTSVRFAGVADDGSWIAECFARLNNSVFANFLRDGALVSYGGQVLPDGSVSRGVGRSVLSATGLEAYFLLIEDTTQVLGFSRRLMVDDSLVLEQNGPVRIPSLGIHGTIRSFQSFDFEDGLLVVSLIYQTASGAVMRSLIEGTWDQGVWSPTSAISSGDLLMGSNEFFSAGGSVVSPGGAIAALVRVLAPNFLSGVLVGDQIVAIEGTAGPVPGSTWTPVDRQPRVRTNSRGDWVITGAVDTAAADKTQFFAMNGVPIVQEGEPFPPGGSTPVESLTGSNVELLESGEVVMALQISFTDQRLLVDGETVIQSGVTQVGGHTMLGFVNYSGRPPLAVSPNGRFITTVVRLSNQGNALLRIERLANGPGICVTAPNSTGVSGELALEGSRFIGVPGLMAVASSLPPMGFGYLLVSRQEAFVAHPGGSSGNLCLAGVVGRYVDQVQTSSSVGVAATTIHPLSLPQPAGAVQALTGETWYFQYWHRDVAGGSTTSNFTQSQALQFR